MKIARPSKGTLRLDVLDTFLGDYMLVVKSMKIRYNIRNPKIDKFIFEKLEMG